MSQDFMDPELFADFIVEAKEHLETIEPNLLELEKNPANLGLLNEIFRPMHSLKGASGFLGLNSINGLAHRAENILDELRKGKIGVTSEIMDVILSATDALSTMIGNLETTGGEGVVETSSIITHIEAILAGESCEVTGASQVLAASPPDPFEMASKAAAASTAAPDDASGAAPVEQAPEAVADEPTMTSAAPTPGASSQGRGLVMPELTETGPPYGLQAIGEGHLNDFLEEANEIIESLNSSLLVLEKDPTAGGELVNDIFRYFHNLKGNSGIIGHKELNALTHEAETLLNRVRKGEVAASRAMIDLLLGAVDMMESMVKRIDARSNQAIPVDIAFLVEKLQQAVLTGVVDLGPPPSVASEPEAQAPESAAVADAPNSQSAEAGAAEFDQDDSEIFAETTAQQLENINLALDELAKDGDNKEYIDGLWRSLDTLRNSAGYMGFADLKLYAERTAGLVDQARKSGLSFDLMLDILRQECSILKDMILKILKDIKVSLPVTEAAAAVASTETAELVVAAEVPAPAAEAPAEKPALKAPKEAAKPKETAKPAADTPKETAPAKESQKAAKAPPAQKTTSVEEAAKPAPEAAKPVQEVAKPAPEAPKPAPKAAPKPAPTPVAAPPVPAAPAAGAAQQQSVAKVSSTIRVDHEKLDHLMNLIGELIINRNRYTLLARSLEEGKLDVQQIAQQLTETTYAMARISDDLQDTIMKVRMVPVSSVFSRFPRLVRDLSRKSGKEVELIMEGEETELDKSVVEVIGDPLVHLIRNSMDHGLEMEDVRKDAGKSAVGHVWLRAYHRGNSVAIEVEDDGKGIDPAKMREVALRKNLITPEEAKAMDDRAAIELIFMPGFSSAETITDISGRGVGMDVVRTNIKNLKGTVGVTSEIGKGSKFSMSLPLTLAIIDALMVVVGKDTYAIPLDAVSETTKIEVKRMTEVNRRKAVTLRGEVLGIVEMREILEMPAGPPSDVASMVILQDGDRRLGVIVDRLLERQEIVIKPLGSYLSDFDMRGISGATIMGDGSVVLILDPHELYLMATSQRPLH